jgi:hypothetical protein
MPVTLGQQQFSHFTFARSRRTRFRVVTQILIEDSESRFSWRKEVQI